MLRRVGADEADGRQRPDDNRTAPSARPGLPANIGAVVTPTNHRWAHFVFVSPVTTAQRVMGIHGGFQHLSTATAAIVPARDHGVEVLQVPDIPRLELDQLLEQLRDRADSDAVKGAAAASGLNLNPQID